MAGVRSWRIPRLKNETWGTRPMRKNIKSTIGRKPWLSIWRRPPVSVSTSNPKLRRIDLHLKAVKSDLIETWLEPQSDSTLEIRNGFKHRGVETGLIVKVELSTTAQPRNLCGCPVVECSLDCFQQSILRTRGYLFMRRAWVHFITQERQAIDDSAGGSELLKKRLRRRRAIAVGSLA
jgi:hypothetical protein